MPSHLNSLPIARGKSILSLSPSMLRRHGLIAGEENSGTRESAQVLVENFSRWGIPILIPDVKGALAGLSQPGGKNPDAVERKRRLELFDFEFCRYPVTFWDPWGEQGHPLRTTVSELGPVLLAHLLELGDMQAATLDALFQIADAQGLLLIDLKDLGALLDEVGEHPELGRSEGGRLSAASLGYIRRGIQNLEARGGEAFFGEPALQIEDLLQTQPGGFGMVNILVADKLANYPSLYSAFLLWLLAELFENLPEVGDAEAPRLAFFFDEAQRLFQNASPSLVDQFEQIVGLASSKGIGLYLITENPLDIPQAIRDRLASRIQHRLDSSRLGASQSLSAIAEDFPHPPNLDLVSLIPRLGEGEAILSVPSSEGLAQTTERALIYPPHSQIGPVTFEQRNELIRQSVLFGHYEQSIDRESAYEKLKARAERRSSNNGAPKNKLGGVGALAKGAVKAAGSPLGKQIIRGILGSIFGGRR